MELLTKHCDTNSGHILFVIVGDLRNSKFCTMVPNLVNNYDHLYFETRMLIPRDCEDTSFDETRLESYSGCLKCSLRIPR